MATLEEFKSSKKVSEGGETMMVTRVARHKTAHQGPANIVMTMDDHDHKLVRKYVNRIRQKQDPSCLQEELFLLPGGKPVNNCTILMQRLGKKYGISVETPAKATAAIGPMLRKQALFRDTCHTPQPLRQSIIRQ